MVLSASGVRATKGARCTKAGYTFTDLLTGRETRSAGRLGTTAGDQPLEALLISEEHVEVHDRGDAGNARLVDFAAGRLMNVSPALGEPGRNIGLAIGGAPVEARASRGLRFSSMTTLLDARKF